MGKEQDHNVEGQALRIEFRVIDSLLRINFQELVERLQK